MYEYGPIVGTVVGPVAVVLDLLEVEVDLLDAELDLLDEVASVDGLDVDKLVDEAAFEVVEGVDSVLRLVDVLFEVVVAVVLELLRPNDGAAPAEEMVFELDNVVDDGLDEATDELGFELGAAVDDCTALLEEKPGIVSGPGVYLLRS